MKPFVFRAVTQTRVIRVAEPVELVPNTGFEIVPLRGKIERHGAR